MCIEFADKEIEKKGSGKKKKKHKFTMYLREDRNWWYAVIQEMWAGKVVAQGLKDVMMIQHAVESALLVDAVIARL